MSVDMMRLVFASYPNGGGEMLLALSLADHAHDDGTHIFPSVRSLAEKTRQSERNVQYQLRKMEECGWLVRISEGRGRGIASEYMINPDWISTAEIEYVERRKKVQSATEKVQSATDSQNRKGAICDRKGAICDRKGAIAVAPQPSRTIIEPSTPSVASKSRPEEKITFDESEGKLVIPLDCYRRWEEVFPKLDLDAEIAKADLWLAANPKRRKKNYDRFLLGWFSRAAEKAKPSAFSGRQAQQQPIRGGVP